MKQSKSQFTQEYYKLWEIVLLIPEPSLHGHSIYSVKYRIKNYEEYSRVTLKAAGVSDALERACYAITYSSPWRPEDVDLQAVYDNEENLLWIDEPFYEIVQKKNEFRGMERREFLKRFGASSAAILYGFLPSQAHGVIPFGFVRKSKMAGEQLYTTVGSYSWTVPAGITQVCVICIGGGSGGYSTTSGGGGQLRYINGTSVTPGSLVSVTVGVGGSHFYPATSDAGGASSFGAVITATGGGGSSWNLASTGGVGGILGGNGGVGATGGTGGSGGGGAGGYSGDGGVGGLGSTTTPGNGSSGTGGAGGGGSGATYRYISGMVGVPAGGGGGTGLYGIGANGTGGMWNSSTSTGQGGGGGSGGANGLNVQTASGGAYGGGGACGNNGNISGFGGQGAVRIIWGSGRSFPSNAT
jgi:hypothetical protein